MTEVDWERLCELDTERTQGELTVHGGMFHHSYIQDDLGKTIAHVPRRDDADFFTAIANAFPAIKAERDALVRKVKALEEALNPSDETKAAYMSEVRCDTHADGLPDHFVPWVSIKNTMSQIRIFAALKEQSHD